MISLQIAFSLIKITLLIIAIVIVLIIKNGLKKHFDGFASRIPILLIGLIPFVWWFVASNHSFEHAAFTCRNFAIFVFAIVFALIKDAANTEKESGKTN